MHGWETRMSHAPGPARSGEVDLAVSLERFPHVRAQALQRLHQSGQRPGPLLGGKSVGVGQVKAFLA